MYFNQIWNFGCLQLEPFENIFKNKIMVKFNQNIGLIWPNLVQIFK